MASLLITLGQSWAVAPEAYFHPRHQFSHVHVLTSASPSLDPAIDSLVRWFATSAPGARLSISRVKDFADLTCAADHHSLEEALFRWFSSCRHSSPAPHIVCLTGGFKTMGTAMFQAAETFGCDGLFHVLCHSDPSTPESIESARAAGQIDWVDLGPRRGWPGVRQLDPATYPLSRSGTAIAPAPPRPDATHPSLREHITASLRQSQHIAERWENLGTLPFRSLALVPDAVLHWLDQPLDPAADLPWLQALPKVELHCHLGGFATHGDALDAVRAAAADPARLPPTPPPPLPEGWPLPSRPLLSLAHYMSLGDATGSALLKDPGCLAAQVRGIYHALVADGILYAEIRCSPGNYASAELGRSPWDVLQEIRSHFEHCREQSLLQGAPACHVNLLLIATRRDRGDFRAAISRHLALAVTAAGHWRDPRSTRVVGVDLAGYELPETRAHYFREEFVAAHRTGLAVTVHAGENDDAEAIWRAVFDLNARRLGHGLHLADSADLMTSVADRRVGVEMCPYANYQIKGFAPMPGPGSPTYPLRRYLDAGIAVSVNTDNIGISAASLSDNLALAARLCPGLTRLEVLRLQANAIETAFLTHTARESLRTSFELALSAALSPPSP